MTIEEFYGSEWAWDEFSSIWTQIAEAKELEITTQDEWDDYDFCSGRDDGSIRIWGWLTQKYEKVGLTREECWWEVFVNFWSYLGFHVAWPDTESYLRYMQLALNPEKGSNDDALGSV